MSDGKLCYVSGPWAYFTTQDLKDQWGDDWNDAPYEHNAGSPYTFTEHDKKGGKKPWAILKVAWEGPLISPCDGKCNSEFSVEQINAGAIAWLRTESWVEKRVAIPAGVTLGRFADLLESVGGKVYVAKASL